MLNKFELSLKDLTEWTEQEILETIREQFNDSQQELRVKKTYWTEYIKLYLNQERKKVGDLLVGSNLLYTQFQEVYSSIDNDEMRVEFKARTPKDEEKVIYTNAVAKFDFEEMNMPMVQRELIWNTIFFGTGILDVSQYDTKRKIVLPSVQSPFTFFVDKYANTIEDARYAGRYIYKTYYELINDSRLDPERVKKIAGSSYPASMEKTVLERKAKSILLEGLYTQEPLHAQAYLELLEWYMYSNGKLWVIWTDNKISTILGFQKVDYRDKGNGQSKIPFVVYYYQKTPFGFWGIGLPDILENPHRILVYLSNLMLQGIRIDATPQYLLNLQAVLNPKDLMTREINKIVFTKVPPAGQIVPFPKTQAVSSDVLAYYQMIINEALGAAGSHRILRGSLTAVRKTATEVAMAKAKQDMLMSSIMRNIVVGEKDFWYRWLKRHQRFMKENDYKLIEMIGSYGASKFIEVSKRQFIPEVDPTIEVVSSLVAEPQKVVRRRDLAEIIPVLGQIGGNVRYAVRNLLRDMDFTPEQIDLLLPPSPHQLKARQENEYLKEGIWIDIDENDNDIEHLEEHYKIAENEVVKLHIEAHLMNYMRKQGLQGRSKILEEKREEEVEAPELEQLDEVEKELTQEVPTEAIKSMVAQLMPQTPGEVK
jgi:hypothetical protein